MMDFMDNLRRGVDRAGFEVDKRVRVNRVRSQIGILRSQMDEEVRQIGQQVVELYDQNLPVPDAVRERCIEVKRLLAEIAVREAELERINREIPPDPDREMVGSPQTEKCPACGADILRGANFCPNCGVNLRPDSARD